MKGTIDMKQEIDDAYERGVEDAWEAAKKIVLDYYRGGLSVYELHDIFGSSGYIGILKYTPALEAIEKIRQYEERKKDFQVGDEVKRYGNKAVVVGTNGSNNESKMFVVFQDGSSGEKGKEGWTKTGRHFPQIAEVLKAMGEAMGE